MFNVDIGGQKGRKKISKEVDKRWKALDVRPGTEFYCDLNTSTPFPFESVSVDNYYCSMTLEHIHPGNVENLFREILRTLKKDGLIRIVVPDIEKGMRWYVKHPKKLFGKGLPQCPNPDDYPSTALGKLLIWFYTIDKNQKGMILHGHKMAYDWETLSYYLNRAGFRDVCRKECDNCSSIFRGKDIPRYRDFALYVEAKK